MTPASFTFKLTVPRDPAVAGLVTGVAAHAATYAEMVPAASAGFLAKVAAATVGELRAADTAKPGAGCVVVLTSADGELRFTIGTHTISQQISP